MGIESETSVIRERYYAKVIGRERGKSRLVRERDYTNVMGRESL